MSEQTAEEIKAEFVKNMGAEFGPMYYALYNDVIWLHIKWQEYRRLYAESDNQINLLNESANTFFYVIQKVLWEDILIHLCRLTDPIKGSRSKKGSKSIENLTLKSLENALVTEAKKIEIKRIVNEIDTHTSFARQWRNKRLAHRDLSHALGVAAVPLPDISRADVELVLRDIRKLMNLVRNYFLCKEVMFESVLVSNGADSLLYHLRIAKQFEEIKRERLLAGRSLPEDFVDPPAA